MRRTPPPLTLSTCTAPVPMEYPHDRVTMQPHAGETWLVSLSDGEATLPIQILVERRHITQDLCDRFRALVRGTAMPPSMEVLSGPRLVDY